MKYPDDYVNKIIQGDCFEMMKMMPDKSIDLILTDPPYGTTALTWDIEIDFEKMWSLFNRKAKDESAIIMTASQPFTSKLIVSNLKDFRYCWIWNKMQSGSFLLAKHQPLKITEDICVFSKNTHRYFPIMRKGIFRKKGGSAKKSELYENLGTSKKNNDDYFPTNLITFSNANKRNRLHPTEKPIELMMYLIKTYSKENEMVCDPFLGSGSTALASKMLGRNFIGIEKLEKYCKIAQDRLRQEQLF